MLTFLRQFNFGNLFLSYSLQISQHFLTAFFQSPVFLTYLESIPSKLENVNSCSEESSIFVKNQVSLAAKQALELVSQILVLSPPMSK